MCLSKCRILNDQIRRFLESGEKGCQFVVSRNMNIYVIMLLFEFFTYTEIHY